ncbi:hypothetical protein HD806DRAFT_543143 [Xylariaceae sp. AK1471]|nr:hypothetical protein HD806DRAFT_543143 [Xylariaceae sp. AK1471]
MSREESEGLQIKRTATKRASTIFYDSGIKQSDPSTFWQPGDPTVLESTPSIYADTIFSYVGGEGGTIRVPPLPNGARGGVPFSCVVCGEKVRILDRSVWKKHLFQDLGPYTCLEEGCPHLGLEHYQEWESIRCSICNEATGSGRTTLTNHIACHLEEISLTLLQTDDEPDGEADNDTEISSSRAKSTESDAPDTSQEPWTVHVSLLVRPDQTIPFQKDTIAYNCCLSRGFYRTITVGGPDSGSFTKAIDMAFGSLLLGKEWMPLQYWLGDVGTSESRPMLRPLDPALLDSQYDLDFLRKHCAVCDSNGKVESLYIAPRHRAIIWSSIRAASVCLEGLETGRDSGEE